MSGEEVFGTEPSTLLTTEKLEAYHQNRLVVPTGWAREPLATMRELTIRTLLMLSKFGQPSLLCQ